MYEIIAFIALLVWPAVPVFLLTLHPCIKFWRKIGAAYYLVPLIIWALAANTIYSIL